MAQENPDGEYANDEAEEKVPRPAAALRLAHGLLVHGQQFVDGQMTKTAFLQGSGKLSSGHLSLMLSTKDSLADRFMEETVNKKLRFSAQLGLVLGISLGTESMRAGLFDCNGIRRAEVEVRNRPGRAKQTPAHILGYIRDITRTILREALEDDELVVTHGKSRAIPLVGVAVAWPCPVHRFNKTAGGNILHRDWGHARTLTERVAETLHLEKKRSHALNDANAAALSVAFDESRSGPPGEDEEDRAQVIMVLRNGGGIGAGTVVIEEYDGSRSTFLETSLIEGATGMAGELGHLPIDEAYVARLNEDCPEGVAELSMDWKCSCGKKGHLEALASGTALVTRVEESKELDLEDLGLPSGRKRSPAAQMPEIMSALKDERALSAVRDSGRLMGHALASPILMLNPRKIVLTGSLAIPAFKEGILEVEDEWRSSFGPTPEVICPKRKETDDNFVSARGAALTVLRDRIYRRFKKIFAEGNTEDLAKPITARYIAQLDRDAELVTQSSRR